MMKRTGHTTGANGDPQNDEQPAVFETLADSIKWLMDEMEEWLIREQRNGLSDKSAWDLSMSLGGLQLVVEEMECEQPRPRARGARHRAR